MSKIFFMQNHVEVNTPGYALPLLRKLDKEGHDILVCADKKLEIRNSPFELKNIYRDFNLTFFDGLHSARKKLDEFNPDLYLTDLTAPRKKKIFRVLHKYAFKKYPVFEMDNRATEILAYGRKNWLYNAQFSPYQTYRTLGKYKYFSKRFLNKWSSDYFFKDVTKKCWNPKIYSNKLSLKGNWWKLVLGKSNLIKNQNINVTGSLRYDFIKKNSKLDSANSYLEKDVPTIVVCPTKFGNNFLSIYYNKVLKKYIQKITSKNDFNIVFKLHPTDTLRHRESKANFLISKKDKVCSSSEYYSLLRKSDLLLSQFSTAGIEAAIFDVPNIFISKFSKTVPELNALYRMKNKEIGIGVSRVNISETAEKIHSKELNFNFRGYRDYVMDGVNGHSHIKISKAINSLIRRDG